MNSTVAVYVDDWKLPIFERLLAQHGHSILRRTPGFANTTILSVSTESLQALAEILKRAEAEARRTGKPPEPLSYPATCILHTPNGPHPCCGRHAAQLEAIMAALGAHTHRETLVDMPQCLNCINEATSKVNNAI
jgi:hypothetical protein